MESEEIYNFLEKLLPLIEIICGTSSFLCNAVYGVRFWKFRQFHENLRKSTLLLNFIICFSPILHPLTIYLSNDKTPLLHGKYMEAAIIYTIHIFNHLALLFLHTKFFVLLAERVLAYRNRRVYEYSRNRYVFKIFGVALMVCLLEMCAKLVLYLQFDTEDVIDIRLYKALTVAASPGYFLFSFVLAHVCAYVGFICLRRLKRNASSQRHNSSSLSERFELRQTEMVTKIMLPLNFCYIVTLYVQFFPAYLCVKLTFYEADAQWWRIYEVSVLYCYMCVGMYNLVATVYTFLNMRTMSRPRPRKIHALTANDETDKYFAQLEDQWSTGTKNKR